MDRTLLTNLVQTLDRAGMRHLDGAALTAVVVGAWLLFALALLLLLRSTTYRVGAKHLKIAILGIPVRRVRLDNIRNIHTRKVTCLEKWHNMLFPTADRLIVIEKRRGLFKRMLITPEQRYIFKAEMDRAIRARLGMPPGTEAERQSRVQTGSDKPLAAGTTPASTGSPSQDIL